MTLPLIHALSQADEGEKKEIMRVVRRKRKSQTDVEKVRAFVGTHSGIEYATRTMMQHADNAMEIVLSLPESDARSALADLVRFTVTREK